LLAPVRGIAKFIYFFAALANQIYGHFYRLFSADPSLQHMDMNGAVVINNYYTWAMSAAVVQRSSA
jgi:hypothetical protein